jgi:glycine cleavage system protein P-like pyridoxal-binding family
MVNDPLSDLVKFPSCTMKHNTLIEMPNIFCRFARKTRQQTRVRVHCYRQNKDHTAAFLIVQTPHNEATITQQSGTPKLFITSIQPTRT